MGGGSAIFGCVRLRPDARRGSAQRPTIPDSSLDTPIGRCSKLRGEGSSRVLATHGHAEPLARFLGEQGLDAGVIRTAWEDESGADDGA